MVIGRQLCSAGLVNAAIVASAQSAAPAPMTGRGSVSAVGRAALGGIEPFEKELVEGMNQSLARIKAAAEGR